MAGSNTPPLGLSRDQLATFLTSHEQIKAFENLFGIVEGIAPDVTEQAVLAAGNAQASAAQALGDIKDTAQSFAVDLAALHAKAQATSDAIIALRQQVDLLASEPPTLPRERQLNRWGSFYDTTTQSAAAINTATAMTFNTTDLSNGVRLFSPSVSQVVVDTEGVYNIQFSAQLDNTTGGNHTAWIWLRVNSVDVPNSAGRLILKGTDGDLVASWNYFQYLNAQDYFEIMWAVSDTNVQLIAAAAAAPVPAIPSVILTVCMNFKGVQ